MKDGINVKNIVPKCGADFLIPFAAVYAFYIILHGHLSPGGGFQGGPQGGPFGGGNPGGPFGGQPGGGNPGGDQGPDEQ